MESNERADAIGQKLQAAIRRELRPFGVDGHRFRLMPPASESRVQMIEATHDIKIPPDYRAFITRVAGGGAGPAYGLIPFEDAPAYERAGMRQGTLAKPFPLTSAYNPDDDPLGLQLLSSAGPLDGALAICHEGCGHLHLLVVCGPAYGQMWCDGTVSDGGFASLGVGFFDWYERWLDDCLAGGDGVWWMRGSGPTRA
jgi:hypothetical protein